MLDDQEWGVCIDGTAKDPKGFFVYHIKKKYGLKRILMPPLTPYGGPWIFYPKGQKKASSLAHEKKVCEALIEQLPAYDELIMDFHPRFNNWLPFHWKAFFQNTLYTYRIRSAKKLEVIRSELKGSTRRALQKGEEDLEVQDSEDLEELFQLAQKDFRQKGVTLYYDKEQLQRVDRILSSKRKRRILYAKDREGRTHAGIYLVFDGTACYYLLGAGDRRFMHNGAMALLLWEGIRKANDHGLLFDLEGSMIPNVEHFFRSFGAEQTPYHHVEKSPSLLLRARKGTKKLFESS